MLIGTRFADVAQVHRVKFPGGARTQLTFYPERTGGARFRPLSGDGFVFNKDVGGGEWYQLFWRDEKTGQGHDVHGRQVPQHGRRLLAFRQVARLPVHAAEREGQRHLGRRPGRPEDREKGPRGLGRRMGRLRLVARRQDASRGRIPLREREPLLARGRGDGREDASRRRSRRRRSPGAAPSSRRTASRSTRRRTRARSSTASCRSTSRRRRSPC